jgi:hypothetical protein
MGLAEFFGPLRPLRSVGGRMTAAWVGSNGGAGAEV